MNKMDRTAEKAKGAEAAALATPTDLSENGVKAIASALNTLCADTLSPNSRRSRTTTRTSFRRARC